MSNKFDAKYSKLTDTSLENGGSPDGEPLLGPHASQKKPLLSPPPTHRKWLFIQGILLVINLTLAIFVFGVHLDGRGGKKPDIDSPIAMRVPEEYETVKFVGNFDKKSIFRGKPSQETVDSWDRISKLGPIRLSDEDFQRMNLTHSASSVKFSEEDGGGYMGSTTVFHQLHCVKALWQHTYIQYFPELMEAARDHCDAYHAHLDHCADILRQSLMCYGDVNVITYNWVKDIPTPWPNFDVQRTCKKFEPILNWNLENEVTLESGKHVKKPASVVEEPKML